MPNLSSSSDEIYTVVYCRICKFSPRFAMFPILFNFYNSSWSNDPPIARASSPSPNALALASVVARRFLRERIRSSTLAAASGLQVVRSLLTFTTWSVPRLSPTMMRAPSEDHSSLFRAALLLFGALPELPGVRLGVEDSSEELRASDTTLQEPQGSAVE